MIASGLFFMLLFSCAWELEPKFDYMLYIYIHMKFMYQIVTYTSICMHRVSLNCSYVLMYV